MASHLDVIGIQSHEEFVSFMTTILEGSEYQTYEEGLEKPSYHLLADSASVWIHTQNNCFIPAHKSNHEVNVRVSHWLPDEENNCPFCALLVVDVLGEHGEESYPLAIAVGNCIQAQSRLELGSQLSLNISVFAERGLVWKNVEAYKEQEYRPDHALQIGPGWFFPGGPFNALPDEQCFKPFASFFGTVESTELLLNPVTQKQYRVAAVRCADIVYSVVMDVREFPKLQEGNVMYINGWFCVDV